MKSEPLSSVHVHTTVVLGFMRVQSALCIRLNPRPSLPLHRSLHPSHRFPDDEEPHLRHMAVQENPATSIEAQYQELTTNLFERAPAWPMNESVGE